jgi:hypothetical protein
MEKAAHDFLRQAGELYEKNKKKWSKIIKDKGYDFSEDIYSDSIIKTYDAIIKKETDTTDYLGYWHKTFINNTKRDKLYAKNKCITVDVYTSDDALQKENKESEINVYFSRIYDILLNVHKHFDRKTFEVFRLYMLCGMSYQELDNLTGMKSSKAKISRVKKWLHDNKIQDN